MTDPTNDVLRDLRECVESLRINYSNFYGRPYNEQLLWRAADEIERLLRGDFTDSELTHISETYYDNFERLLKGISGELGERTT